jgi:hypothetical protein
VKGHALNAENNRCDSLAVAAANSKHLLIDEAYEEQNPFSGVEPGSHARDSDGGNSVWLPEFAG